MTTFVTNLDIFVFMRASGDIKNSDYFYEVLVSRIPSTITVTSEELGVIQKFCRNYITHLYKRWQNTSRNEERFFKKYESWLEANISWPMSESVDFNTLFNPEVMDGEMDRCMGEWIQEDQLSSHLQEAGPSTTDMSTNTHSSRKAFEYLGNKQKKRRCASLVEYSEEELLCAFILKLKENKKTVFAKILECLSCDSSKVEDVNTFLFQSSAKKSVPEDETLALVTALNLSKWQYLTLRSVLNDKDIVVFPSYQKLLMKKKECYPLREDITITESGAQIRLQAILDLTAAKILKVANVPNHDDKILKIVRKYGMDGASSQSCYKQKPSTSDIINESSVFMVSYVPLRLMCGESILWENPRPSSTNLCRPVMFQFKQETKEYILQVEAAIREEIAFLVPTKSGKYLLF